MCVFEAVDVCVCVHVLVCAVSSRPTAAGRAYDRCVCVCVEAVDVCVCVHVLVCAVSSRPTAAGQTHRRCVSACECL